MIFKSQDLQYVFQRICVSGTQDHKQIQLWQKLSLKIHLFLADNKYTKALYRIFIIFRSDWHLFSHSDNFDSSKVARCFWVICPFPKKCWLISSESFFSSLALPLLPSRLSLTVWWGMNCCFRYPFPVLLLGMTVLTHSSLALSFSHCS